MPETSEQLVWAIARSSAFLTVGFVVVWTALKTLRIQSPRVHRFCWLIVLVQGLVLVTFRIEVPVYEAEVQRTITWPVESAGLAPSPFEFNGNSLAFDGHTSAEHDGPQSLHTAGDWPSIYQMVLIGWIAGIIITLARLAVNYFRFTSGISDESETRIDWEDQWNDVCASAGIRRQIRLTMTQEDGPALCWTFGGYRLLIPQQQWENLSVAQRELVLRHELAHYQRGDLWLGLLFHFLTSLHWFNPFAWFAVRRLAESVEWSCDAAVSGATTANCTEYVEALLEFSRPRRRIPTIIPTATGHSVVRRAQRLLTPNFTEDSRMKKLTVALIVAALAVVNGTTFDLVAQESTTAADSSTSAETSQTTEKVEASESAENPDDETVESTGEAKGETSHEAAQQKVSADPAPDTLFLFGDERTSGLHLKSSDLRLLLTEDAPTSITVPANIQIDGTLVKPTLTDVSLATREAVIDISYVFRNLPEFERLKKSLQKDVQLDDQRLHVERKSLQHLIEKLKHATDADERKQLQVQIFNRDAKMKSEVAVARRRMKADEAKIYATMYTKVRKAIAGYAKEHNIQIVRRATTGREQQKKLESGDPQAILQAMNAQVLYIADDSIDITDAVLERLKNDARETD